jgi:Probable taurine catabolism dioxygenase
MPGLSYSPTFNKITVTELHPTFGAEISGVDFSRPVEDDAFQEIKAAIDKVGRSTNQQQNIDEQS